MQLKNGEVKEFNFPVGGIRCTNEEFLKKKKRGLLYKKYRIILLLISFPLRFSLLLTQLIRDSIT